jgi:quercetin dioxygenase-like cupin family protein
MKRRNFLQQTATLIAAGGSGIDVSATGLLPPKKAFRVKALESRFNQKVSYSGIPIDFKLLSNDTENRLSVFISSNNRKGFGPPLHVHYSFDEFFTVLEGSFEFTVDDETLGLSTGDTLFIPRKVRHSFQCVSNHPGTLLVAMTPAKGMETYFAEMAVLLDVEGQPDLNALQALFKRYDSAIVGPPMK